jgi:DNA-binding LacI/PurR family transcriptional regulator
MKKTQPTIKDIAEELSISFSTVSRALHNNPRIGLKTRELVHRKAKELNYIPNPVANILKSNKTKTIGILVPNLHEEFFVDTIEGIENVIEVEGYHAIIMQSKEDIGKEKKAIESFLRMRIDGLIVSLSEETDNIVHFKELEKYGIPVVFFDRVPVESNAHKVKCNTATGAEQLVSYLVNIGKKRIAFLNGPAQLETSQERLKGVIEGHIKNNINLKDELLLHINIDERSTEKAISFLVKNKVPDAIICFNDLIAIYAAKAIKKLENAPLVEPIIAGFGNLNILKYVDSPPKLTVEQHPTQMGVSAAKLLLQCIEKEEDAFPFQLITLASNLVILDS